MYLQKLDLLSCSVCFFSSVSIKINKTINKIFLETIELVWTGLRLPAPHTFFFNPIFFYILILSRDGPDQSSPQIGQFSGNTALESVYSTSNVILIKFHSDFSGAGFFVLSYHGKWQMLWWSRHSEKCAACQYFGNIACLCLFTRKGHPRCCNAIISL